MLVTWEASRAQRVRETFPRARTGRTACARMLTDPVPTATTTGLTSHVALAGLPSDAIRVIRTLPRLLRTRRTLPRLLRTRRTLPRLRHLRVVSTCAPKKPNTTWADAAGSAGTTTRGGAHPPSTRTNSAAPAPRMTAASSMKAASRELPSRSSSPFFCAPPRAATSTRAAASSTDGTRTRLP